MRRMYSLEQLKEVVKNTKGYDFANLVDADGHDRFIEGDINLNESVPEEITKVYGKWSLSGSHLMFVLCIDLAVKNFTSQTDLAHITLPSWVMNKIAPLFDVVIDRKTFIAFANDYTTQEPVVYLEKHSDYVSLILNAINVTPAKHCRIEFDLLIDNN